MSTILADPAYPTLGYWNLRGLASPIRILLALVNQPFNDIRYDFDNEDPENRRKAWLAEKNNLGLDFPNIPYFFDPAYGIKMTESKAILRHIAETRAGGALVGVTPIQKAGVTMVQGVLGDFQRKFSETLWSGKPAAEIDTALDALFAKEGAAFFESIEKFIARNGGPFILGPNVTIADVLFFDFLDGLRVAKPELAKDFPLINTFYNVFANLPGVFVYLNSPQHKATVTLPAFSPYGAFLAEKLAAAANPAPAQE